MLAVNTFAAAGIAKLLQHSGVLVQLSAAVNFQLHPEETLALPVEDRGGLVGIFADSLVPPAVAVGTEGIELVSIAVLIQCIGKTDQAAALNTVCVMAFVALDAERRVRVSGVFRPPDARAAISAGDGQLFAAGTAKLRDFVREQQRHSVSPAAVGAEKGAFHNSLLLFPVCVIPGRFFICVMAGRLVKVLLQDEAEECALAE